MVHLRMSRANSDGQLIAGKRFVELSASAQRIAEVAQDIGVVGSYFERTPQARNRLCGTARAQQRSAIELPNDGRDCNI